MNFSTPPDLRDFFSDKGILRTIAFSGGAASASNDLGSDVDEAMARANDMMVSEVITQTLLRLRPYRKHTAILTGGTKYGIPATASRIAKKEGFFTVGILPAVGAGKALPNDVLDIVVCIDIEAEFQSKTPEECSKFGSDWGDESSYFAKILDGVVVLGGGAGTLVEIGHILKLNERRLKRAQTPKYIVPIAASGGMAAATAYLPAKPEVKNFCMPNRIVRSGQKAAELLEIKLNMFDLIDQRQITKLEV